MKSEKISLSHIAFYHDLRNKLYHNGNGITVPIHEINDYAQICVRLLSLLLDVDLSNELLKPQLELEKQQAIKQKQDELYNLVSKSQSLWNDFLAEAEYAIEIIEPNILLPSFKNKMQSFYSYCTDYTEEQEKVILDMVSPVLKIDANQYLSDELCMIDSITKIPLTIHDKEVKLHPSKRIYRKFKDLPIGRYIINTLSLDDFCGQPRDLYISILNDFNVIPTETDFYRINSLADLFCSWSFNYNPEMNIDEEIKNGKQLNSSLEKASQEFKNWKEQQLANLKLSD